MKRDKLIHTLLHGHSWMVLCKSRGLMHVQSKQPAQSVWGNRCSMSVLQLFLYRWHGPSQAQLSVQCLVCLI